MWPKKPDLRGPAEDCKAWWVDYLAGRFSIMGSVVVALFGTTFEGLEAAEELLDHFAEYTVSQAEDLDRRRLFDAVIVPDLKLKIVEYREHIVGKDLEWLTQKETQAPAKPPEAGRPPQGLTPRPAAAGLIPEDKAAAAGDVEASGESMSQPRDSLPDSVVASAAERRAALEAYKRECREAGVKVTNLMIAKAADPNWNDRTPVEKWVKAKDPRYNTPPVDRKIRAVFRTKPHIPSN